MLSIIKKSCLLLSFVFLSTSSFAAGRIFLVSDIDETLKQANIQEGLRFIADPSMMVRKKSMKQKPFRFMKKIIEEMNVNEELKGQELKLIYLTGSFSWMYNARLWLRRNNFVLRRAKIHQRKRLFNKEKTKNFSYKHTMLKRELSEYRPGDKVYFFGDNAQEDEEVYLEVIKDLKITDAKVFIRDVRMKHFPGLLYKKVNPNNPVNYFISASDIISHPAMDLFSNSLVSDIRDARANDEIVPKYIKKRLKRRLKRRFCRKRKDLKICRMKRKQGVAQFWKDYKSKQGLDYQL